MTLFPVLILTALTLSAFQARAQSNAEELAAMQQCRSYLDCTIIWSGCSDLAINKAYVEQFKQVSACSGSTPHNPKALPTCEENRCVIVVPDTGDGT
ncbi:MAG: hypothetical protein AB7H77_02180 [Bdellovibrionales bacterium]